jgi:hypothetical protein
MTKNMDGKIRLGLQLIGLGAAVLLLGLALASTMVGQTASVGGINAAFLYLACIAMTFLMCAGFGIAVMLGAFGGFPE